MMPHEEPTLEQQVQTQVMAWLTDSLEDVRDTLDETLTRIRTFDHDELDRAEAPERQDGR